MRRDRSSFATLGSCYRYKFDCYLVSFRCIGIFFQVKLQRQKRGQVGVALI